MCLIFGLMGCGQKSVVKTDVHPQTFAEAYGDGKLLRRTFPLLITTDPFASPLPDLGIFFGGFAKIIANTLADLGAGRTEMYFHQPTPDLPEEIREVRLKRVFFYIEPKLNDSRKQNWFNRIFRGRGNVDFDFIKKLVIRIKPEIPDMKRVCLAEDQGKFSPLFPCKDPVLNQDKIDTYLSYFKENRQQQQQKDDSEMLSVMDEFVILKYSGDKKEKFVRNSERGKMYMFRTSRPAVVNHFFDNRSGYKELIDNMVTLDNVILVELKKDPVAKESFEARLSVDAEYIDANLGVEEIEECNPQICLDVKVEDANILPFLRRLNSNRIDAFIDAGKVPETFQLKGFLDFEIGAHVGF